MGEWIVVFPIVLGPTDVFVCLLKITFFNINNIMLSFTGYKFANCKDYQKHM